MHRLLERQLRRVGIADPGNAPSPDEWQSLLERVSQTYAEADQDRYLLERSLAISSQEMLELNEGLRRSAELTVAAEREKVTAAVERSRLQEQLVVADRMVSMGTLAAGVAHEINNPLAAVIGNLDVLIEDHCADDPGRPSAPQERREMLAEARESAERVRLIVRDLKTLSRADEERRGPVHVEQVLDSVAKIAGNEIRHRAQLEKDYGGVPPVHANEARLGQVFLNLLLNAAQAIPEGAAQENRIRLRTRADGGGVAVEVCDTGSGIPEEIRARIFDPFFTTKPIGSGTGLGLSICHSIVHGFGGKISVESEVGRGSVFRVRLPPASEAQAPPPPRQVEPPVVERGRILVVDDEPVIGRLVERLVRGRHEVIALTSAREALELLTSPDVGFDLILCDLMMPDMTGMDLHDELSRRSPALLPRMVFATGGAFTPRALEFLDAVPNRRLEKPFDRSALDALIRERLTGPPA